MSNIQEIEEILSLTKAIENINENRARWLFEKELMMLEIGVRSEFVRNQTTVNDKLKEKIEALNRVSERQKQIGAAISTSRSTLVRGSFEQMKYLAEGQVQRLKMLAQMRQESSENKIQKCIDELASRCPVAQQLKEKQNQLVKLRNDLQKIKDEKIALQNLMENKKQIHDLLLQQDIVEMVQHIVRHKQIFQIPPPVLGMKRMQPIARNSLQPPANCTDSEISNTHPKKFELCESVVEISNRKTLEKNVTTEEISKQDNGNYPLQQNNAEINDEQRTSRASTEILDFELELTSFPEKQTLSSKAKSTPKKNLITEPLPGSEEGDIQMNDADEAAVEGQSNSNNDNQALEEDDDLISNWSSLEVAVVKPKATVSKTLQSDANDVSANENDADSSSDFNMDLNFSLPPVETKHASGNSKNTPQKDFTMEFSNVLEGNDSQVKSDKKSKPKETAKKALPDINDVIMANWDHIEPVENPKTYDESHSKQANVGVDNLQSPNFDMDFSSLAAGFESAPNLKANSDDQLDFLTFNEDQDFNDFFK